MNTAALPINLCLRCQRTPQQQPHLKKSSSIPNMYEEEEFEDEVSAYKEASVGFLRPRVC